MSEVNPLQSFFGAVPIEDTALGMFATKRGDCGCWTCTTKRIQESRTPGSFPIVSMPFIVCDLCGNKRCPRATHHDNICTESNEPGQYGGLPDDE